MSTLRGGRRHARRWPARRTRWFVPATLALVGVAAAGILTAPRAGLDLTGAPADTLQPAQAAAATGSTPTPATTTIVAATTPSTAVATPVVTSDLDVASGDLESFFVAVEGGDLVGAFDHLTSEHQAAVGGFEPFEALWRAPAGVAHDPADCAADDGGFACTITFRTYAADGTCSAAVYAYRLRPTGTRNSITEERPIAQRSCSALETTTTAATG